MYVIWLLHRLAVPPSLPLSSGLPIPWDTTILKSGQLITLRCPLKCSSERKSRTSLTLNQKLEMIKLSEEDMPKTKIRLKAGLLHQTDKLWMQRKNTWRKLKSATPRTSLVVQWIRLCTPKAGGPDSIPSQGTRSRMHAATKTWRSQINKFKKKIF